MSVERDHLPTRFPVGTRYVVEGRGGPNRGLRIRSRYLEFPDGRHMDLPISPLPPMRSLRRRRPSVRSGSKKILRRAGTKPQQVG